MGTRAVPLLRGPEAWRGQDLERATDWIRPLGPAALAELDAALRVARGRGRPWQEITREDFPLGALSRELAAVAHELEHGRGLVLLRGLPVARYTEEELKALFTDRCDVVALLCVRPARAGGVSKVASSVAVSNEILRRRPDLHALLCAPYWRSREGEEAGGEGEAYALPVFAARDGRFTSQYSRTFVEAAQRLSGVPRLTSAQDEALDLLAEVAEALCLRMEFQPGDLQLLNNHVVYHGRTPYEDDPAPGRDRLLYRLWLATPGSRALPEGFEVLWGATTPGALRGGIAQPVAV